MTTVSHPGGETATKPAEIVLVGNPNTGKSTLFNRLTGARQRVGNYPGVTVEKKQGTMRLDGHPVSVIDLPGTYSLAASSADERVVIDVLSGHVAGTRRPDLAVCVVDATNLMRNLFLVSQVAETGLPLVIALNMTDAAADQGIEIDVELLSERLGVPVVPTVASKGRGTLELREAIAKAVESKPHMTSVAWPDAVRTVVEELRAKAEAATGRSVTEAEALRILVDSDPAVADGLGWTEANRKKDLEAARQRLEAAGFNPLSAEAVLRYGHIGQLLDGVIVHPEERKVTRTESADRLLTHRVWGLVIFAAMMYIVFQSIYTVGDSMIGWVEAAVTMFSGGVSNLLEPWPLLQTLVVDGMVAGVGSVVVFLPQILILFFFIALLEDTGYMARAAFLMDKLFSWCGLNGKSFVPMLSGYACAVPAVMGARTIEDPKARLTTILITPLMSCSARLPVYVLLIGALIPAGWQGLTLFGMHFLGLALAIPIALVINRGILRGKPQPFVLEMPSYRVPNLRDVIWRMLERGKEFLVRAGTVIFAMSVVIWALTYFPRPERVEDAFVAQVAQQQAVSFEEAQLLLAESPELQGQLDGLYMEQSYIGRMGKAVQPIFAPAGFDWKITVGVLSSFPARETILATMGILYNLGSDVDEESAELRTAMTSSTWEDGSHVFTPVVAVAVMVFFALCLQCGSTVAVIARESNWGWAIFAFVYMTVLAWVGAVVVYQVGSLIAGA